MANHKGNGGFNMRGGIEYPLDLNPNHPNSDYWHRRYEAAMQIIIQHEEMIAVWDSEIVPQKATMMIHALLAEKISIGKIGMELKWGGNIAFENDLGAHFTIEGGEVIEFGSPQWFDNIQEIPL